MRLRPKFSTLVAAGMAVTGVVLLVAAMLLGRSNESGGRTIVTVRLWDEQVAEAYRESFAEFTREHPDIDVRVNVVAYSTYFDTLRTDVAGGGADDIFWISNAYFAEYADTGRLMDVAQTLGANASRAWEPSVVDQFTRDGALWGVPQLTDAGIALYFNADLLDAAGVELRRLLGLRWSLGDGRHAAAAAGAAHLRRRRTLRRHTGIRRGPIRQWGYNAANDLQGIYLNYIGSAGGVFSIGDRFAFDNPQAAEAFEYLVRLINTDHVAPPASDTNDNGDFSRNQFLQGRMALFQSGTYNLAAVADQAPVPLGRGHAADRTQVPGQRHQRHCRRRQFGQPASRRRAAGAGLDGQYPRQRVPRHSTVRPSRPCWPPSRCTTGTGGPAASTSARSSRCSTALASPLREAPDSPPDSTR